MDKNLNLIDGELFKRLATKGAEALYKKKQEINDLNVFPVPDGDTGDNMCHTMEGGLSALAGDFGNHLGNMAKAFARGTLLKARGNSGVILSQLFRGLAEGLSDKAVATPTDWAKALRTGVEYGYKSVVNPVEGTILTVARMGAEGLTAVTDQTDLEGLFGGYLNALTDSLKNTPNQLKTLKEAGVVDSGGAGLTCIAEGFLMAVTKRDGDATAIDGFIKKPYQKEDAAVDDDEGFGFCTEVLLELSCPKFSLEDFKCELTKEGKSIVAVTMGDTLKVHVHTLDPLKVLGMCAALGELITVKVENMTRQHAALNIKNEDSLVPTQVGERLPVAVVAISQGPGFDQIYLENGADAVVSGGQTDNPSVEEYLKVFSTLNAENIIVLPNNKNVVMAARAAADMYTAARVTVANTKTPQEVYSALVCGLSREDFDLFLSEMEEGAAGVTDVSLTYAVRDASFDGVTIKKDDYMAFLMGKPVFAHPNIRECLRGLLDKLSDYKDKEIVTVFYGKDVTEEEKTWFNRLIEGFFEDAEVVDLYGGQDVYPILISLE